MVCIFCRFPFHRELLLLNRGGCQILKQLNLKAIYKCEYLFFAPPFRYHENHHPRQNYFARLHIFAKDETPPSSFYLELPTENRFIISVSFCKYSLPYAVGNKFAKFSLLWVCYLCLLITISHHSNLELYIISEMLFWCGLFSNWNINYDARSCLNK